MNHCEEKWTGLVPLHFSLQVLSNAKVTWLAIVSQLSDHIAQEMLVKTIHFCATPIDMPKTRDASQVQRGTKWPRPLTVSFPTLPGSVPTIVLAEFAESLRLFRLLSDVSSANHSPGREDWSSCTARGRPTRQWADLSIACPTLTLSPISQPLSARSDRPDNSANRDSERPAPAGGS